MRTDYIVRDENTPLVWLFANMGGVLGLAQGCSLITVIEIFYFAALM